MRIVQSTWVRYHHFDLARELHQMGHLERIFTCLPWWKADKESREQAIPRDLISCNFLMQGLRRVGRKLPFYTKKMDFELAVQETRFFSKWVAHNLPECDAYIGISGSGLHAGKLAISRGAGYIMDRGSSHMRFANELLNEEYSKWGLKRVPDNPWLIENEEKEIEMANIVTVPSLFAANSFKSMGVPSSKLRIVPYGVSVSDFHFTEPPPSDCFRILFVGNFCIRKGAPYLLEAFKNFKHNHKELIIVGSVDAELSEILYKYNDLKINFLGTKPRVELKHYMSTSHVLVLPSVEDGFGLVLIQAAACGCPVIGTTNTGFSTLFESGKDGILVGAQSSIELTQAFDLLASDDKLRQEMGNSCLNKVNNIGGWKTYANGMVNAAIAAKQIVNK